MDPGIKFFICSCQTSWEKFSLRSNPDWLRSLNQLVAMGLSLSPNTSQEKRASSNEYVSTEFKVFYVNKRREISPIGGCLIRLKKTQAGTGQAVNVVNIIVKSRRNWR